MISPWEAHRTAIRTDSRQPQLWSSGEPDKPSRVVAGTLKAVQGIRRHQDEHIHCQQEW
jgi:hypothetical protein